MGEFYPVFAYYARCRNGVTVLLCIKWEKDEPRAGCSDIVLFMIVGEFALELSPGASYKDCEDWRSGDVELLLALLAMSYSTYSTILWHSDYCL